MTMKSTRSIQLIVLGLVLVCTTALPTGASAADGAGISDSTVKILVERELARRGLAKSGIEVEADDHIVTLSGTVSTLAEREKIERAAGGAYAVARVVNNLVIGSAGSDQEIAEAVRKSIVTHPDYDVFDWIEGQVTNGVVTLSGSVREPWRKNDFEKRVMNIAGVAGIENQIKALPLSNYDDQLRLRAARIIYGSSTLNRYALGANPPIHVIVENGRVVLKGIVASKLDRQVAESLVRTNLLAFEVRNELQIENAL